MATRPFVVDPVLSAISIGFRNPASFKIADQVLPRLPVMGEKFKWTEYPLNEAFETPDAEVGRLGAVQQIEFGGEEKDGSVKDYGLDTPIPFDDIDAAENARSQGRSTYDPESHSVEMLTDTMENIRELRVAKLVHNPATYAPDKVNPLSGTSQFNDYDNSDPIGVIKAGLESTLVYMPNTLALGRKVWTSLSSHPKIVNAVKGNLTNAGIVTREQFAELFADYGVKDVLIGDAWTNTAKKGQATNLERAWGNHIAMLHINPMASVEGGGITFGFTAEYNGRISGRIENPKIGLNGGVDIRVGERIREIICAKDVGYLIQNAVAG